MAKTQKEYLIKWLNDAYSMEKAIAKTLENHMNDAKDLPSVYALLEAHFQITNSHADRVRECIENLGGNVSEVKSGFAQAMGVMKELPMEFAGDEVIKNAIADFATEHFEIASYTSLAAAAKECGENEIADICNKIISEEVEMANRLSGMLPTLTQDFLRGEDK